MKLLIFLCCLLPLGIVGQTTFTKVVDGGANVGKFNMALWYPDATGAKRPTIIFVPGKGEMGTDVTLLYVNGPFNFTQAKTWNLSQFTVVAIQPPQPWPPERLATPYFMRAALKELLNGSYPIDPNQFYLTGLSDGAVFIYNYIQNEVDSLFHWPAAVVPMSMSIFGLCGDYNSGTDQMCGKDYRFAKIPFWGFCGNTDPAFALPMVRYVTNGAQLGWPIWFNYYNGGHSNWNSVYNPNATFTRTGMVPQTIYNFMLQYRSAGSGINPLHAKIWVDSLVIHYPNTSVWLADSSTGSHNYTSWGATAYPTGQPGRWSDGPSMYQMLFANLVDGSYQVQLIIEDNLGNSDTARANLRVYGPVRRSVTSIVTNIFGVPVPVPLSSAQVTYSDGNP